MISLHDHASDYVALRRAVGFKLARTEQLLFKFVDFVEQEGTGHITSQVAVRWAMLPADASPTWWANRLCVVRGLARYMVAVDPATEVPPTDVLPRIATGSARTTPYLYTADEVAGLLAAARSIRSTMAAATCQTIIGLLSVTGMRVGEALRLERDDVDLGSALVCVRDSKFDRSRLVPLHDSTVDALNIYTRVRDERFSPPRSPSFFVSRSGGRLSYHGVNWHFARLVRKTGMQPKSARCRPRLHDFRHAFACATLEDWYRSGVDTQPLLPLLSTYLGHVDPASTYWYLSGKPELLGLAAQRLEASMGVLP